MTCSVATQLAVTWSLYSTSTSAWHCRKLSPNNSQVHNLCRAWGGQGVHSYIVLHICRLMREGLTILALFFNSGVLSALTQNETENSAFFKF